MRKQRHTHSRLPRQLSVESLESRMLLAVFTVDSLSDTPDANTSDGICGDAQGDCSLRAAIHQANTLANTGAPDEIHFNIAGDGPHTIAVGSKLSITEPIVIDGYTQSGASPNTNAFANGNDAVLKIELDGTGIFQLMELLTGSSTIRGLSIYGPTQGFLNGGGALSMRGTAAQSNTISGNYFGMDAGGNWVETNIGISMQAAQNNVIGGSSPADRNLFGTKWINIYAFQNTTNTQVIGNYFGTTADGMTVLPDANASLSFRDSPNNTIGGIGENANLIVSGTGTTSAVSLSDSPGTVIQGNLIGSDLAGTTRFGNSGTGIRLDGASSDAVIGGSNSGEGNLILARNSIDIRGDSHRTTVQGNLAGTDKTGTVGLSQGDILIRTQDNVIGGDQSGDGNVVVGRVDIAREAGLNNTVQGNSIGTDITGTLDFGISSFGARVNLQLDASNNLIGGTSPGQGNTIAFGSDGAFAVTTGANTNRFLGNRIINTLGTLIDLGGDRKDGVTANDSPDADGFQNKPVITSATSGPLTIAGTLESLPNTTYRIEFFASPTLSVDGHGAGDEFLGAVDVTTDSSGSAIFNESFPSATASSGDVVAATATDLNVSTSEFSAAMQIDGGIVNPLLVVNTQDSGIGSLRRAFEAARLLPGAQTVTFAIPVTDPGFIDVDSQLPGGDPEPDAYQIQPLSVLPHMGPADFQNEYALSIDGMSQSTFGGDTNPFGPEIILDGSQAGEGVAGLELRVNNSTTIPELRGLTIHSFDAEGIHTNPGGPYRIAGNYIGTDATGTMDRGNGSYGIRIQYAGGFIGGVNPEDRNVISGNDDAGVLAHSLQSPVTIEGNFIGTTADGLAALGNDGPGVWADSSAPDVRIGGTTPGAGNVISANTIGVRNFRVDNANFIVQGNFIGTDATGTQPLGNLGIGILTHAAGSLIGGSDPNARNIVSGNGNAGIQLGENSGFGTPSFEVLNNYIGTDVTGNQPLGNGFHGISIITDVTSLTIGRPGAGNIISGNSSSGIQSSNVDLANTVIQSNIVGLGQDGDTEIPNALGIVIPDPDVLIGGVETGEGNVVASNDSIGIQSAGMILGNMIGTDATGRLPRGNRYGIVILSGAIVGDGTTAGSNVIASNRWGIATNGGGIVRGNFIGTDRTQTLNLGNTEHGVLTSGNLTLGGIAPGEGNVITNNIETGVLIRGGLSNSIVGNSIYGNGLLGIDIGQSSSSIPDGVTPNDTSDSDTGFNNLQNFPVIDSATPDGSTITGSLNSLPDTTFAIDFYATPVADNSGYGEGKRYLGSIQVTTNGNGDVSFSTSMTLDPSEAITATATDADGNTSEFSVAFGSQLFDLGDAPLGYSTLGESGPAGGAHHVPTGVMLGQLRDAELNASLSHDGFGDDAADSDDEDGVQFSNGFVLDIGTTVTANVEVNGSSGNARIYGWVDFNGDGDFEDSGEQIADGSALVSDGITGVSFVVPDQNYIGLTYARIRTTTDTNVSFAGFASDGEVEDYQLCVINSELNPFSICRLTDTSQGNTSLASASNDGSRIAYARNNKLHLRDEVGNKELFSQVYNTAMRSDGQLLAFTSTLDITGNNNNDTELFLHDFETAGTEQLTNTGHFSPYPYFAPDSPFLVYVSNGNPLATNSNRNTEIFLLNTDTNELIQVTNTSPRLNFFNPTVDSAGRLVTFSSNHDLTGSNSDNSYEVFLVDLQNNSMIQITDANQGVSSNPRISGDGSTIAFISSGDLVGENAEGNHELFIYDRTLAQLDQATDLNLIYSAPTLSSPLSISPDGANVALTLGAISEVGLYLYSTGSKTTEQLLGSPGRTLDPSFNGDGTRLYFSSNSDDLDPTFTSSVLYMAYLGQNPDLSLSTDPVTQHTIQDSSVTISSSVTNPSSLNTTNLELTAALPSSISFVSDSLNSCSVQASEVTCILGNLDAGQDVNLSLDLYVAPNTSVGDYIVDFDVTATETESTMTNNASSSTITIDPPASQVLTSFVNGTLTATGDAGNSHVRASVSGTTVTLEGLDGTRIDGQAMVQINDVDTKLIISLAQGMDHLEFVGQNSIPVQSLELRLIGGRGDDLVELSGSHQGLTSVFGGRGNDQLLVSDAVIAGLLKIKGNTGLDHIDVVDSLLELMAVQGGSDNDMIWIDDSVIQMNATIDGSEGNDVINIDRRDRTSVPRTQGTVVRFESRTVIRGGGGSDAIGIGRPGADDQSTFFTGTRRSAVNGGPDADTLDAGVLSDPNAHGNLFARRLVLKSIETLSS